MDSLIEKIIEYNNPTVVGLDPDINKLPKCIVNKYIDIKGKTLESASLAILEFNKKIIDVVYDIVPCVKPQSAYYEQYGFFGIKTLYETIQYAKEKGMYVILDGKRNDIGSTMSAYSNAYLGCTNIFGEDVFAFNSDSLTINTYLGRDTLNSLIYDLNKYNKTVFNLVKTSNPSSCDLQDKILNDEKITVSSFIAKMCEELSIQTIGKFNFTKVGAVIGATYSSHIEKFRKDLKHTFFLIPGYGAQGASGKDVKAAFNKDGIGAIINASRSIIYSYLNQDMDNENYYECIKEAAIKMKEDINYYI